MGGITALHEYRTGMILSCRAHATSTGECMEWDAMGRGKFIISNNAGASNYVRL